MATIINNVLVERCLENGLLYDEGTYAYVYFVWECSESVSSITFRWKSESDSDWTIKNISASGKSGIVESILCEGNLDPELRYEYTISVITASSKKHRPGVLKSAPYLIDKKTEGRGLGIGRTAELENVVDIEFRTRLLGGMLQPILPYGTDLNDVIVPNVYASGNVAAFEYQNCPFETGTFIFKVESAGNAGQLKQTAVACNKLTPATFIRFYYSSSWGEWMHEDAVERIIYTNDSGTSDVVTLSEPVSNFEHIEIYYTDNNGRGCGYTKVRNADGKFVHLGLQEAAATTVFLRQTVYTISGTKMTPNISAASIVRITAADGAVPTMGTSYIKVTRVVGRA